jgi:bifunctional DNA-binding transcriptional regulator/antitoxin component of YhaV-PrlF toxin-antitoxin module
MLRERFGLTPGTEVEITPTADGVLVRRSVPGHPVDRVSGILDGALGATFDVDEYIEEARGR